MSVPHIFTQRFTGSVVVCYSVSHTELDFARDIPALLLNVFDLLDALTRHFIYPPPTREQRNAYYDAVMNQRPCHPPLKAPWPDRSEQILPEPIWTNIHAEDYETIFERCYGGTLVRPPVEPGLGTTSTTGGSTGSTAIGLPTRCP